MTGKVLKSEGIGGGEVKSRKGKKSMAKRGRGNRIKTNRTIYTPGVKCLVTPTLEEEEILLGWREM